MLAPNANVSVPAIVVRIEPYLTSSAIVTVTGPGGTSPSVMVGRLDAIRLVAGLAELPGARYLQRVKP